MLRKASSVETDLPRGASSYPAAVTAPCCSVSRTAGTAPAAAHVGGRGTLLHEQDTVALPAGSFVMGSTDSIGYRDDGEGPVRTIHLAAFTADRTAVTNDAFAAFVEATGYRTEAERFGWSFVFGGLLPEGFPATRAVAAAPWWRQVEAAWWRQPEGPGSGVDDRSDHPVVHVSWNDAQAYCAWAGARLPPRPNGSTPHAEDWRAGGSHGEISSSRM